MVVTPIICCSTSLCEQVTFNRLMGRCVARLRPQLRTEAKLRCCTKQSTSLQRNAARSKHHLASFQRGFHRLCRVGLGADRSEFGIGNSSTVGKNMTSYQLRATTTSMWSGRISHVDMLRKQVRTDSVCSYASRPLAKQPSF